MHHRSSRKGENPTAEEVELVARAAASTDSVWAAIAARIGVDALFVVFDELGGEKVHVPTREHFLRGIWVPMQREAILTLRANGVKTREIAEQLRVSRRHVCNVVHGVAHAADDSAHPSAPCSRA